MMRYFLLLLMLLGFSNIRAQEREYAPPEEEVFMFVEEMPEFPGGTEKFIRFISENIEYPQPQLTDSASKAGISGTVYTSFVVGMDSVVRDIKIKRSLSAEFDKAVIDVLRKSPKWKPGKQNGRPVAVQMTVPVRIQWED